VDDRHQPESIDVAKDAAVTVTYLDGYVAQFDLMSLRKGCPCATCRNLRERGEDSLPRPTSPLPLRVEHAELHGAWGLNIAWNDGHATGIYSFEMLRQWHETAR
jgi:prepilin-type processing-associated H-X9-DG protein